jgi:hypothetical protein
VIEILPPPDVWISVVTAPVEFCRNTPVLALGLVVPPEIVMSPASELSRVAPFPAGLKMCTPYTPEAVDV